MEIKLCHSNYVSLSASNTRPLSLTDGEEPGKVGGFTHMAPTTHGHSVDTTAQMIESHLVYVCGRFNENLHKCIRRTMCIHLHRDTIFSEVLNKHPDYSTALRAQFIRLKCHRVEKLARECVLQRWAEGVTCNARY